jgi:uncharacterized phage infection (PIP) family protein YhgE
MGRTATPRLQLVMAIAALTGIVFAVTGCGSSSDETTTSAASDLETWAGDACTAVTNYRASIARIRATLRAEDLSRPALQVAIDDASQATREFTDDLYNLGPPPTPQADEAKKNIRQVRNDLGEQDDKIVALASGSSGGKDVKADASTVTDTLDASSAGAKQAIDQLRNLDPKGDLAQAFDSADSCSSL